MMSSRLVPAAPWTNTNLAAVSTMRVRVAAPRAVMGFDLVDRRFVLIRGF